MTTQTNKKPAKTLRYGGLKATIWMNPGSDGRPNYLSVSYTRTYKDDQGEIQETTSFSEIDNLKLGILQHQAAVTIANLKAEAKVATGLDNDEGLGQ